MQDSNLYHLIQALKYGTNLQIGVLFFGTHRDTRLILPKHATIHTAQYCWTMKETAKQFEKCFYCRENTIERVISSMKPFGRLCVNGSYEYTYPIVWNDKVIGTIFIGNILLSPSGEERIKSKLKKHNLYDRQKELFNSFEYNFSEDQCHTFAKIIENYIISVLKLYPDANNELVRSRLINDVIAYFEDNLTTDFSFEKLAKLFHYNKKYLGRRFKKEVGVSMRIYLCQRRIEHAKNMLRGSDLTVTEIASKVGFENVSYFNRRFSQFVGMSPSEWRNQKTNNINKING